MRRRRLVRVYYEIVVVLIVSLVFAVASCLARPQHRPMTKKEGSLKNFLRRYVGVPPDEAVKTTRYSAAFVDLRDDGTQEVIVYLTGPWCGTGGCTMLVLAPEGESYRVVTKITVVQLPIWVSANKSNGWHDLGVGGRLSGDKPLYGAILSFDGKTYPSNPSVPPARRMNGNLNGKILIRATAKDTPLFQ